MDPQSFGYRQQRQTNMHIAQSDKDDAADGVASKMLFDTPFSASMAVITFYTLFNLI